MARDGLRNELKATGRDDGQDYCLRKDMKSSTSKLQPGSFDVSGCTTVMAKRPQPSRCILPSWSTRDTLFLDERRPSLLGVRLGRSSLAYNVTGLELSVLNCTAETCQTQTAHLGWQPRGRKRAVG